MPFGKSAALSARPDGAGHRRQLVIENTGDDTAVQLRCTLEHNGDDVSELLAGELPASLGRGERTALRILQGPGPWACKVIVTWNDDSGTGRKWIGAVTRWAPL
jgi:hypothetical protein